MKKQIWTGFILTVLLVLAAACALAIPKNASDLADNADISWSSEELTLTIDCNKQVKSLKCPNAIMLKCDGVHCLTVGISDTEYCIEGNKLNFSIGANIIWPINGKVDSTKKHIVTADGNPTRLAVIGPGQYRGIDVTDGKVSTPCDPENGLYAESGETVEIEYTGTPPAGKVFAGFSAEGVQFWKTESGGKILYTFNMPDHAVTVTPVYRDPSEYHKITIADGYALDYDLIKTTSALPGERIYIMLQEASCPAGKYCSSYQCVPGSLSIDRRDYYFGSFLMPGEDVTLTPVYADQVPGVLDLRGGSRNLITGEENWKYDSLAFGEDAGLILYNPGDWSYDLDKNGTPDVFFDTDGWTLKVHVNNSIPLAHVLSLKMVKYNPLTILFGNPTVTFSAGGGTGTMDAVTVSAENLKYTLPACGFTPPAGKMFDAWDKGAPGTAIDVWNNMTVTALWKDIPPDPTPEPTADPTEQPDPPVDISKVQAGKIPDQVYSGSPRKPRVTLTWKNEVLKEGTDYTLAWSKNVQVGEGRVSVTGKNRFTGTAVKTFRIIPKGVRLSGLTAGKKKLTVRWKKGKNITGYEIQYSLKKNFKGAKKIRITRAKTTKAVLKKLKSGKTYYVRVRAYKKVAGKIYYSAWSAVRSKKTK